MQQQRSSAVCISAPFNTFTRTKSAWWMPQIVSLQASMKHMRLVHAIQKPSKTYHLFALERNGTCNLAFAILIGNAFRQSFLSSKGQFFATTVHGPQTFVSTAIDANEFPKVMPTTGAYAETTSMGASAVPFGIDFGAIYKTKRWVYLGFSMWMVDKVLQNYLLAWKPRGRPST